MNLGNGPLCIQPLDWETNTAHLTCAAPRRLPGPDGEVPQRARWWGTHSVAPASSAGLPCTAGCQGLRSRRPLFFPGINSLRSPTRIPSGSHVRIGGAANESSALSISAGPLVLPLCRRLQAWGCVGWPEAAVGRGHVFPFLGSGSSLYLLYLFTVDSKPTLTGAPKSRAMRWGEVITDGLHPRSWHLCSPSASSHF